LCDHGGVNEVNQRSPEGGPVKFQKRPFSVAIPPSVK
jgi:hypothetical protein